MPLEGHWQRQQTPLRSASRRERRTLAVVASIVAAAAAVVLLVAVLHDSSKSAAGCVDVVTASTTGGARMHACGMQAAQWCQAEARRSGSDISGTLAACREAGYR